MKTCGEIFVVVLHFNLNITVLICHALNCTDEKFCLEHLQIPYNSFNDACYKRLLKHLFVNFLIKNILGKIK